MAIKVFLANDHDIVREGLKNVLSKNSIFNICGEYNSNVELINYIEKAKPSLLFFDVISNDNVIIRNLTRIRIICPKIMIIAIIYVDDYMFYHDFISLEGINGFLKIDFKTEELIKGLSVVLAGKVFIHDVIKNIKKKGEGTPPDVYGSYLLSKKRYGRKGTNSPNG